MPFYDYRCTNCETVLEVKAGISEKERGLDLSCPECASKDMEQVYKSMAFVSSGARSESVPSFQKPSGPCGSACGCFN